MGLKEVKITCPGPSGIGTEIEIDGKKVDLVTRIEMDITMMNAPLLKITKYFSGGITGKFDVTEDIILPDQPGKRYRLVEVNDGVED